MSCIRMVLFCALILYAIKSLNCERYKIVETNNGKVRGLEGITLLKNVSYFSFKSIPYAKPPVGDLRFKVLKTMNLCKLQCRIYKNTNAITHIFCVIKGTRTD